MGRDTTAILSGTGTLYIAPTGTAYPVDPSVAPSGTWVDVGYSEDGWALHVTRTVQAQFVAEVIDPYDIIPTAREGHFIGSAVQGSLENLQTALGGGTITVATGPPATKKLVPGASDVITPVALLWRTKAPPVAGVAKTRDVQMPNGISIGAVELAGRKAPAKTQLAMDFQLKYVTGFDIFDIIDLT